jgi:CRP/FNR family transcriptional regulator
MGATSSTSSTGHLVHKLRPAHLFRGINDTDLALATGYFYETRLDKDSIIFYERDVPSPNSAKIYCVLDGCVKLVKYSSDGESTIVRLCSGGEFFGVTGALTGKPYPFSAEALVDTTALVIDRAKFIQLVEKLPHVALNVIVDLGEVLWFNYETHNQVVKKTDARVSKILLHHLERDGYLETPEGLEIKLRLPHDYLASMTGIAYEESVRIVSRLKKAERCLNYLRGGKIVITNLERLKQIANADEAWGY